MWTDEQELEELKRDIARERFALRMSERAEADRRVCDRDGWMRAMAERRAKIASLEREAQLYTDRIVA